MTDPSLLTPHSSRPKGILFDLDGTLADTAPDLAHTLNRQRELHGLPALPLETIRPYASKGARGMLQVGFNLFPTDVPYNSLREEYLELYEEFVVNSPALFAGITKLLSELDTRAIRWAICTNKPSRFTLRLVELLELSNASAIVCGDAVVQPKPDPSMLTQACELMQLAPAECLYVGDDRRDCEAACAAGMPMIVAYWGYIGANEDPRTWGARALAETPDQLLNYL
ncbi:MAG: HAD family hydrolase [Burkholderiales bacterium]